MSLADQIRDFIETRYLAPARKAGHPSVTLNAGDVHRQMRLQSRLPAVCSAMRSHDLLDRNGVTLEKWDGPSQGSKVDVTYTFLQSSSSASGESSQSSAIEDTAALGWSAEIPFEGKAIESMIPHKAGVYRILQLDEYPRYRGLTRILKIGTSKGSLQQELLNHLTGHTAANRLARLRQDGETITGSFVVQPRELASAQESRLLQTFEDEHWELPLLNGQRGYARGTDAHYRD